MQRVVRTLSRAKPSSSREVNSRSSPPLPSALRRLPLGRRRCSTPRCFAASGGFHAEGGEDTVTRKALLVARSEFALLTSTSLCAPAAPTWSPAVLDASLLRRVVRRGGPPLLVARSQFALLTSTSVCAPAPCICKTM